MNDQPHIALHSNDRVPQTVALMVVLAAAMVGTTVPTSLYTEYGRVFGFSLLVVTVVYSMYAAGVLVALVAFGTWSDVLGRRPVLGLGVGFAAASDVAFLVAGNTAALLVARFISGLSAGVFISAGSIAIIEMARGRIAARAPLLATLSTVGGLGVGPILAAVMVTYAPQPLRTIYWVHLALMAIAAALVLAVPETRPRQREEHLGVMTLNVPTEVRDFFIRASLLGFAGFAVMGLFASLAPTIAAQFAGVTSVIGKALLAATIMGGSLIGQLAGRTLSDRGSEVIAIALMLLGMLLLVATFHYGHYSLLAASGLIGGCGQGVAFARGLSGIAVGAPPAHKAGTTSAYFFITYIAISVPVVAEGFLVKALGVRTAGTIFACVVSALALIAGVLIWLEHIHEDHVHEGSIS